MTQQNFNMVDDGDDAPVIRPSSMLGADRSGERGGPARGNLKPPSTPKTNVKKEK